jgi:RimJ/RimL family protein N-acetyltransferase
MLCELRREEFRKIRSIFEELAYTLAIDSVIEGNRPGKIYVDDVESPKTALVWAKPSEFFLAGHPDNHEFNSSLQKLMIKEVIHEIMKHPIKYSVLFYGSDAWEKEIRSILKGQFPKKGYRILFTFKKLKVDWKRGLPAGFYMERIDEAFLKRTDLKNINKVTDQIDFKWNSIADFTSRGFGFALLHRDTIVSWCISSNNVREKCEITIGTDEKYQNRGFATLLASAFVERCISKNLTPSWHCGCNNLPSIAVAEKVGFEKTLKYPIYYWIPNTHVNLF